MLAASTASAPPTRIPSERCAKAPTPPEAITGTLTASLTAAVADAVPVPVIASGGVGTLEHLADGITVGGADAVLAASIFHYGEFTVAQAKALMARDGIPVRL